jgi:hypothetical protein
MQNYRQIYSLDRLDLYFQKACYIFDTEKILYIKTVKRTREKKNTAETEMRFWRTTRGTLDIRKELKIQAVKTK